MEIQPRQGEPGIDMSFVNLAEGKPESAPETQPPAPKEFGDVVEASKPVVEVEKAKIILADLQTPKIERSIIPESPVEKYPEVTVMERNISPEEFIKKYGSMELQREASRPEFTTPSAIAYDIYSHQPSALLKTISAATIPALAVIGTTASAAISQAGLSTLLATDPIVLSGQLGAVLLATGLVIFTGYKTLKTSFAKRAFKKNFGKSLDETLGFA